MNARRPLQNFRLIVGLLVLGACSQKTNLNFGGENSISPASIAPSYAAISKSVFEARCYSCHSGPGAELGYDLTTLEGALAGGRVIPYDPAGSPLYILISDNSMPPSDPLES